MLRALVADIEPFVLHRKEPRKAIVLERRQTLLVHRRSKVVMGIGIDQFHSYFLSRSLQVLRYSIDPVKILVPNLFRTR